MYSVHAYYLAFLTRCFICSWFYPVVVTITAFFFFKFDAGSFSDMLYYMASLASIGYCGMLSGVTIGCFLNHPTMAYLLFWVSFMIFNFGGGFFVNLGSNSTWIIKAFGYFDPVRYSSELQLRIVTKGRVV